LGLEGSIIDLDLLGNFTLMTSLDGELQESETLSDLLSLGLLIIYIDDETGIQEIGFIAQEPFDEIQILVTRLVEANPLADVRIYGAFVDTHKSNGGPGSGLECFDNPLAVDDQVSTPEEEAILIDVMTNDDPGDVDELVVSIAQQPAHGHVVINAQQQIVYTPDPNFVGEDIFSYMICDE